MALLLLCPYTEPFWPRKRTVVAMAIAAEPHCRPRHHSHNILFGHQYSSSCSCFRYICHSITLGNVLGFAIRVRNRSSIQRRGVMSMVKDNSSAKIRGTRRVVWTMETELEAGQLLYVTGEPSVLGGWESDMAILMSSTEHANLWKAEVQIASGVSFKYNYFIKEETSPYDVIWRPGPEFSLSVPHSLKRDNDVVVRDLWVRSTTKQSSKHSLISWIEDSYFHIQPSIPKQEIDGVGALSQLKSDLMESKLASDLATSFPEPISDRSMIERYQPVEEPWLLQSPIFSTVSEDKMVSDISVINEHVPDDKEKLEDTGKLPQEGKRDSISTMILINSSICTMQRIAVLEDGQLVELLLEPVKNHVLCDSVYLGMVTKLVPHMGGALVNIGGSRPSLMDIKPTREPFIFPPFRHETITPVNGALVDLEISDQMSGVASQEELEQTVQDEDEENDSEDELDESEIFAHNVSGGSADHGELEADYEDDIEGKGETVTNSFYANMNVSVPFQMPNLPDLRGSGNPMTNKNKWSQVKKGTKIIVQVVKEGLGTKGPTLTAYPKLRSRFWVMITRCDRIGISKKISGVERTRLKVIAKTLQPKGFGLTVRTVAAGCSLVELQKDLEGLLSTWKNITEQAKSASLAADEGVEGAVPVILNTAMGQTLSVVQDYFNEKVEKMIVDSARTYYEVTNYLQDISPGLCDRVELHSKRIPLFDEFNVEEEINNILSKRVLLANGGSLVIEQTEALVSIDVNGGHVMFGQGNSQEKAILDVNLAAAKQIARELRLRDIGGIIVVDFIDMIDESNKRLVYEEVKNAVERDRSMVKVSELSKHGLMEITRKRVRPSVTFMISEPCSCCHATGRVVALETSFSKIEQEISRLLATVDQKVIPPNPKFWPKFVLRVDHHMCEYLTSGKRTRLALLSSSLKVWILLKVARGFTRGTFEVKPFTEDKGSENQHQVTIPVLRTNEAKNVNPGKKVTLIPVKKWKTGRK